jgi:hypothetical protein
MTTAAPRRDGSQIPLASLVFVTQFTIASNGTRHVNRITHDGVPTVLARSRVWRSFLGWVQREPLRKYSTLSR